MVLGPDIDPPAPQNNYRPCGVYHYPDTRAGYEGRTAYELWNQRGECVAVISALAAVRPVLEPRLWEFLDLTTDVKVAVGEGPRLTPRSLGLIR